MKRAKDIIRAFIVERLDGDCQNFSNFNLYRLTGDDKYGCPGRHFEKNDIAYIYVTGAAGKIKYKTFVEEIDIPFFDGIQKRYLPNHIEEEPDTRKFVKLRLEAINDKPLLYFSDMKSVGEKLCMIRHFKLNNKPRLIEYIQDVFC